jgi:hypothetical protein
MTDRSDSGLHIDDDWKAEAAREKQRLAAQEEKEAAKPGAPTGDEATFIELINTLAMQAVIGLGGLQGPGGDRIPPNPLAAKHYIEMLELLQKKTAGNLSDDEKQTLDAVLYELRMQYVHLVTRGMPAPSDTSPPAGD